MIAFLGLVVLLLGVAVAMHTLKRYRLAKENGWRHYLVSPIIGKGILAFVLIIVGVFLIL